jgi:hypothetical protein
VLSARARLVRIASGATAMAAATLMATSFHVVPTMAAESGAGLPVVQTAVLRAAVLSSADAAVGAPVCLHRLAKPAVAPAAPVSVAAPVSASAPVSARPVVAPAARVLAALYATPGAVQAPQSVPAMAPPSPVGAPASPAIAPAAAPPSTPPAPELAPVAPAAPADEEKNKKKSTYVYRMTGPDGNDVVIINGKVRALTPEEKEQIEKAMEQFKNGDFAKHMADMQREMADLRIKDTFDSREFREKMETAQRELAQSALVNSAELQAKVQAMMKNFDTKSMNMGHCKDGVVKDKDKTKQKQTKPQSPQIQ